MAFTSLSNVDAISKLARVVNAPSTVGVYESWINFTTGAVVAVLTASTIVSLLPYTLMSKPVSSDTR